MATIITGTEEDIILIDWHISDGGCANAGFPANQKDCAVRAISHVTDSNYKKWHNHLVKSTGDSINKVLINEGFTHKVFHNHEEHPPTTEEQLDGMSKAFTEVYQEYSHSKCVLMCAKIRDNQLSGHATAIVNGQLLDTWDCTDWRVLSIYYD